MRAYLDLIEKAYLVREVKSCTTTGDVEYPGTALEITDKDGNDLFHVVVDSSGERQVLFFASDKDYRLPLDILERIVATAKEKVGARDIE